MRPGVTRQPDASKTDTAAGTGSSDDPTPLIRPPVIATQPPGSSRREPSHVATSFALATRRSAQFACCGMLYTTPWPVAGHNACSAVISAARRRGVVAAEAAG